MIRKPIFVCVFVLGLSKTASRWRPNPVLMKDSFKMVDSLRNEANDCFYEWVIQTLTQIIYLKTDSFKFCSLMHKCSALSLSGAIFIGET